MIITVDNVIVWHLGEVNTKFVPVIVLLENLEVLIKDSTLSVDLNMLGIIAIKSYQEVLIL